MKKSILSVLLTFSFICVKSNAITMSGGATTMALATSFGLVASNESVAITMASIFLGLFTDNSSNEEKVAVSSAKETAQYVVQSEDENHESPILSNAISSIQNSIQSDEFISNNFKKLPLTQKARIVAILADKLNQKQSEPVAQ